MDPLSADRPFNLLSLTDVLAAREQFHVHLMHKANVVGTAVGRYLVRKGEPRRATAAGDADADAELPPAAPKAPRTLENSEVREDSWPCVLVFVREWAKLADFGGAGRFCATDYIPEAIYLPDGRSVPLCVVLAPPVETAPAPVDPTRLQFPRSQLAGGYPVLAEVQGETHVGTLACLLSDGHKLYALTNRHVAGEPGEELYTSVNGDRVPIGKTSDKQLGRLPFEKVYEGWPGRSMLVNVDAGLIELRDQRPWSPAVYGVGPLGPLADLSTLNLTLDLVGAPVRAHGAASGRLAGRIAALFYRYQSVGGLEHVADFLIGARGSEPLATRPGDSGALWVLETGNPAADNRPLALQWGGAVFTSGAGALPFALATNLSTVCRTLEVDVLRSRELAGFEYWGAVGHYTIGAFACELVKDPGLRLLMLANQDRVSFTPAALDAATANAVSVPGFVPLADVPDKVWKKPKTAQTPWGRKGLENPNHYADMDYVHDGPSLDAITAGASKLDPQAWRDWYKARGWSAVSQRGLLPFRVWQIYKALVGYAQQQDLDRFVCAAGVLAHYVGDASQPLHTSYLDDGDPFRKPDGTPVTEPLDHGAGFGHDVHTAYEDDMLDANVDEIAHKAHGVSARAHAQHVLVHVKGGRAAGYSVVELARRARGRLPPMTLVEAYAALVKAGKKSQARTELWTQFKEPTLDTLADGCRTLAMLWESAWLEGNGPQIAANLLVARSQAALQQIYEDPKFLPSLALGQIDAQL